MNSGIRVIHTFVPMHSVSDRTSLVPLSPHSFAAGLSI